VQAHARHLNSVLRMRCAEHDRGCASEEDSVTAAQHGLIVEPVTESETWSKVVAIANGCRRVQANCRERSARIVHSRIGEVLQVVTEAEVEGEFRRHAPVVLNEEAELVEIG